MVNTFIVHKDFLKSARSLDKKRLQKQCLEAYQILNILFQFQLVLYHLGKLGDLEKIMPTHFGDLRYEIEKSYRRSNLCKKLRADYLAKKKILVKYDHVEVDRDTSDYLVIHKDDLPYKVRERDILECEDCSSENACQTFMTYEEIMEKCPHSCNLTFHLASCPAGSGTKFFTATGGGSTRYSKRSAFSIPRDKVCSKNTEIALMGFGQHAIVKMWFGYESSLYDYISAHLIVLEERGITMELKHDEVIGKMFLKSELPIKPWWITHHRSVILSHRASLLRKELKDKPTLGVWPPIRTAKPHLASLGDKYQDNPSFVNEKVLKWLPYGYVWVNSLNFTTASQFLNAEFPSWETCAKPQNYDVRYTSYIEELLNSKDRE